MMLYLKIQKIMREKNIRQVDILETMYIEQSRLSAIIRGKELKNISLRTILGITKALDVDIYELIEGTEYDEEDTYL